MNKKMMLAALLLVSVAAAVLCLPRSRQRHFFCFQYSQLHSIIKPLRRRIW